MALGIAPTGSRPIAGESSATVTGVPLSVKWTNDRELDIPYTDDNALAAPYEPGVEE